MAVTGIEIKKAFVTQGEIQVRVDFTLDNTEIVMRTYRSVEPNEKWLENQIREEVARLGKLDVALKAVTLGDYILPEKS